MPIEYMNLAIDHEFEALCPPLTESEMEHLAASIEADGVRDAVVYWSNSPDGRKVVIDGHNRKFVAEQVGSPYPTLGMEFPDRDAVMMWMLKNQLGRRNVTPMQRDVLLARMYQERVKPVGNPNCITVTQLKNPAENDPFGVFDDEPQTTAEAVAEDAGVSPATVNRALANALALKTLGLRAPTLRQAALAGTFGPKAVQQLAKAPDAVLQSLEGLEGRKLKAAVKAAMKPKPPTTDESALLDKLDEALKAVLKAADAANESTPSEFYSVVIISVNRCKEAAKRWRAELVNVAAQRP